MKPMSPFLLLQAAQSDHDQFAHTEIHNTTYQARLNHYVLHFFKYASNLDDINCNEDKQAEKNKKSLKQIRDTFLLLMAIGNNLNIDWDKKLNTSHYIDFRDILKNEYISNNISEENYISKAFHSVLKKGAKLAKVIESIDHMEPIHINNSFEEHSMNMLKDLLPIMGFMQEVLGIDFEENIHITHALIKAKKPWANILYMNTEDKGILVKNEVLPSLNYYEPFETNVGLIKESLNKLRTSSTYKPLNPNLIFLDTIVEEPKIVQSENDLIHLQVLQNRKEFQIQIGFNNYVSSNIKTHVENCSFRFLTRMVELPILYTDKINNKDEIINNVTESFIYLLSIATKLNLRVDKYSDTDDISFSNTVNRYTKDISETLKDLTSLNIKLSNWHIKSSTFKEDKLSMTNSFLATYEELLKTTFSVMGDIQKEFNIDIHSEIINRVDTSKIKNIGYKKSNR
jgi:hypothetical protein